MLQEGNLSPLGAISTHSTMTCFLRPPPTLKPYRLFLHLLYRPHRMGEAIEEFAEIHLEQVSCLLKQNKVGKTNY